MNELTTTAQSTAITAQDMPNLAERFYNYIDVKAKSAETYKGAIKQFLLYLKGENITQPSRETVINWRETLRESHKATTIQLYITAVKLFFSYLAQEGIYPNIAEKLKGAKIRKEHKRDCLTSNQSKSVLSEIDTTSDKGKRDYAMIALLLTTGLRTIEIIRADIADLRTVGDDTVLFVQGKGRDDKSEYVKIAPQVERVIRQYLKTRDSIAENEPLFASEGNHNHAGRLTTRTIRRIVKDALLNVGLNSDRLTAHSLRHTAATIALLKGADIAEVQQMLRHSNINTTMIYSHALSRAQNNSELTIADAIL